LRAERSDHHFKNSPQAHNGRSIKRHIFGKLFCAQRPGDARQMQRHLRERPGLANDFRSEPADQHPYQAARIGIDPKAVTGKSGLKITSLVLNRDAPFLEKKIKNVPRLKNSGEWASTVYSSIDNIK
jgi:hypothetical protein